MFCAPILDDVKSQPTLKRMRTGVMRSVFLFTALAVPAACVPTGSKGTMPPPGINSNGVPTSPVVVGGASSPTGTDVAMELPSPGGTCSASTFEAGEPVGFPGYG